MENDYVIVKDGTRLTIELGKHLNTANAPALMDELANYRGQDIQKIVFDGTGLIYLTSSGIRVFIFAYQKLGKKPEIVFVNCAKEIYAVLDSVNLTKTFIRFEENVELKRKYRQKLGKLDNETIAQHAQERKEALENYEAHNDVVAYAMKLGAEED